jgi:hypothetical protein
MRICCPVGRGCNAQGAAEPCLLELCRSAATDEPDAALAALRWREWQRAREGRAGRSERRFRLRAYERARDRALVGLLMRALGAAAGSSSAPGRARRPRVSPPPRGAGMAPAQLRRPRARRRAMSRR